MSRLAKEEGIKVTGHKGTWYVIDSTVRTNTETGEEINLYLLEHETYGDAAACVIIDEYGELVLDDVWNGFDDYDEAMELE